MSDELTVHSFGFGLNQDGKPSVSFTITLPNGLEGGFGWVQEPDDLEEIQRFLNHFEPKLIEKMSGAEGFTPTIQSLGFEADKP